MIPLPSGSGPTGVRVWLATRVTDMRKGMNGLMGLVQDGLKRDPHSGDLFVFRGRRGHMVKVGAARFIPSDWNRADLSGPVQLMGWCRYHPHSLAICWRALIGVIPSERGSRKLQNEHHVVTGALFTVLYSV